MTQKAEKEIDTWVGKPNTVLCELYRSSDKTGLSNTAKLSVFISVFVPIFTYGNESKSAIPRGRDGIFSEEFTM